jgi:hypothetical protein
LSNEKPAGVVIKNSKAKIIKDMKTTAIKTKNNNYLIELPENYYFDAAYINESGEFLRFAGGEEFNLLNKLSQDPQKEWIEGHYTKNRSRARKDAPAIIWIPGQYHHYHDLERHDINVNLQNIPSTIIVPEDDYTVSSITIDEDYSNFSPEKCCNGGDYGFWTDQITIMFKGRIFTYEEHYTTAEFAYDGVDGYFDQKASSTPIGAYIDDQLYIFQGIDIMSQMDIYIVDEEKSAADYGECRKCFHGRMIRINLHMCRCTHCGHTVGG